ncbi:MAG: transporter substrate-binding domain-containing protein [Cytophagales bacterium]|nr:transporter substrate-binding domain-containing protein [Cytophagales bacterium]
MEPNKYLNYGLLIGLFALIFSCQTPPPCDCERVVADSVKQELVRKTLADLTVDEVNPDTINWIVANSVERDLDEIRKDGVLRALIIYSSTSYFLYRGEPMGFEYELLEQLAERLDLKLELVISADLDSEFEVLNRGEVDLIAHGMTVTNERKWEVAFTEYLYLTRQVLVQRQPDNFRDMKWSDLQKQLIHDPIELINDTVSIRQNSAYSERMRSLSNEIGGNIYIDTLKSNLSTDQIIKMVIDGEIKYTIADENLAKINAAYHPILKIDVPVSFSQRIAWVTRKKSPQLRKAVNEWILSERKRTNYNVTYNKYFKNKRNFRSRERSEFYSLNNRQISQYDELIKRHAKEIDWDWRLLASQVYQESRFDPKADSWAGAKGLMQVMPKTAKSLGIKNLTNPAQSLRGGVSYLGWLHDNFEEIEDPLTRIKFMLAAYNCGYGHMKDAQRLASHNGLNPNLWDDNVEPMVLALTDPEHFNKPMIQHGYVRGEEPVNYVKDILRRYDQYKQFIP